MITFYRWNDYSTGLMRLWLWLWIRQFQVMWLWLSYSKKCSRLQSITIIIAIGPNPELMTILTFIELAHKHRVSYYIGHILWLWIYMCTCRIYTCTCMTLVACQMWCWTKESNILPHLNVVTSNHTPFGLTQPPDAI